MIQAKRSFVKCGDWFTRISHSELCNRVSASIRVTVSLNNEKICREFSKHKIHVAVCEKTGGLRSGNSSDLNSACLKVLVPVEIFQFSDMHYETERYRDSTDGLTRITEISKPLIDLILTNRPENILTTGVIHFGISDHSLIYAVRKFKLPKSNPTIKEVRDFKHFSTDKFRADLHQAPWDMLFSFDDPNICWTMWKSIFHETFHKHAPLRQKRVRSNPVSWITPIIEQTMRNRDFHNYHCQK